MAVAEIARVWIGSIAAALIGVVAFPSSQRWLVAIALVAPMLVAIAAHPNAEATDFAAIPVAIPSLLTLAHLWNRSASRLRRFAWSFALLLPVLGPLFYFAFFRPPRENHFHAPSGNYADPG